MPRPSKPIMPPKDLCDPWLYEILRSLGESTNKATTGLASITRGESPDGSGNPLADLSQYFYLPGRLGGQVGYGGTGASENLILGSTINTTKGKILLGASSAYDEANVLLGIGDATPNAVLHANLVSPPTYIFPDADSVDNNWQTQSGGTVLFSAVNDSDDTDYITETSGTGSGSMATIRFWASGANPLTGTENLAVNFRIRRTLGIGAPGSETLVWTLRRAGVSKATGESTRIAVSSSFVDFSTTLSAAQVTSLLGVGDVTIEFNVAHLGDTTLFYQISQIAFVSGSLNDLIRWDSAGTQLGRISSSGLMGIGTSADSLSAMLTVEPSGAAVVGALILGATSQSGNLLEFRDSASTLLARVTSAGVWDGPVTTISIVDVTDSTFSIRDNTTPTKIAKFECSGISPSTTRTFTFPDVSGTLPTLENAHTIDGTWSFLANAIDRYSPIMFCAVAGAVTNTGPALTDGTGFFGEFQLPAAGLSADRFYAFPDGSGTVVIGGVLSVLTGSSGSTFDSNTSGSGASFKDLTTSSKRLRFILSGAVGNNVFTIASTAARTYTFRDLSGGVVLDSGSALTTGRVPFATTGGALTDSSLFLFSTGSGLTLSALNLITDTTTGMKIGTAATQKLGFWNTAPIVQPTNAIAAAVFVTNTSLIANDTATFDGYTIGQVVKALRNMGLLA